MASVSNGQHFEEHSDVPGVLAVCNFGRRNESSARDQILVAFFGGRRPGLKASGVTKKSWHWCRPHTAITSNASDDGTNVDDGNSDGASRDSDGDDSNTLE